MLNLIIRRCLSSCVGHTVAHTDYTLRIVFVAVLVIE